MKDTKVGRTVNKKKKHGKKEWKMFLAIKLKEQERM